MSEQLTTPSEDEPIKTSLENMDQGNGIETSESGFRDISRKYADTLMPSPDDGKERAKANDGTEIMTPEDHMAVDTAASLMDLSKSLNQVNKISELDTMSDGRTLDMLSDSEKQRNHEYAQQKTEALEAAKNGYAEDIKLLAEQLPSYDNIQGEEYTKLLDAAKELGSNDIKVGVAGYLTHLKSEYSRLFDNYQSSVRSERGIKGMFNKVLGGGGAKLQAGLLAEMNLLQNESDKYLPEDAKSSGELKKEVSRVDVILAGAVSNYDAMENLSFDKDLKSYNKSDVENLGNK